MIKSMLVFVLYLLTKTLVYGKIKTIKICDDISEFPPYIFTSHNNVVGYSVEAIHEILEVDKTKTKVSVELLPWARCLKLVEDGVYDIALNATLNDERKEKYFYSKAFFKVEEVFIYRKEIMVNKKMNYELFKNLIPCGQRGYNYSSVGLDDSKVVRADSIEDVMKFMKYKRCDFFNIDFEVLVGFKVKKGLDYLGDPDYGVFKLDRIVDYHILISKKSKNGVFVKNKIDTNLELFLNNSLNIDLLKKYKLKN